MPTISGYTLVGATSGATIDAWKASRFGTAPVYDNAPPTGSPDAGPITAGEAFGGAGEWVLTLPTTEPYWIRAQLFGHSAWEFRDLSEAVDVGGTPTTSAVGDVAADGTGLTAAREDHLHGREGFGTPGSSAVGDAAANGTATTVARSDHKHGREAFATPSIALGTAAAAGSATTPIRSDSTIAAFDATAPVTQAFGDAAATGSAAVASRRDHKHAMPADPRGLPVGGGLTGAVAATRYVGGTTTGHPTTGTFAVGDYVITQDGSLWVCTTAGTPGTWTQVSGGGGGSSTLAADTDVSITSPSDGQFLKYQSSDSKWHNVNLMTASGGMLLARTQYAPATSADYTTTSATLVAVDATNLTVSFVAPASGAVTIHLHGEAVGVSGATDITWGVGPHSGAGDTASATPISSNNDDTYFHTVHYISGLTPGTSYQYDWFHASNNGSSTVHTYAGKFSNTTKRAPAIMEVYDGATAINQVGVTAAMNANEAQASVISANAATDHFFGTALASKWTQEATAPRTALVKNSALSLNGPSAGTTTYTTPSPAGAFTVDMRCKVSATTAGVGILVRDSSAGDAVGNGVMVQYVGGSDNIQFYSLDTGTYTSRNTVSLSPNREWFYLRITTDGAGTWNAYYSIDRVNWVGVYVGYAKSFTVAKVAIRATAGTSTSDLAIVDFIDVVDGTVGAQAGLVTALPPASGAGQAVVSGAASPYAPAWAGDTAWTAPTLLNSWVNFGGVTPPAGFRKDALGFVHLRGFIKSGTTTAGTSVFVLPAGYRPGYQSQVIGVQFGGTAFTWEIDTDGNVRLNAAGNGSGVALDGISFLAEQ